MLDAREGSAAELGGDFEPIWEHERIAPRKGKKTKREMTGW